jgi:hypothetical protein
VTADFMGHPGIGHSRGGPSSDKPDHGRQPVGHNQPVSCEDVPGGNRVPSRPVYLSILSHILPSFQPRHDADTG